MINHQFCVPGGQNDLDLGSGQGHTGAHIWLRSTHTPNEIKIRESFCGAQFLNFLLKHRGMSILYEIHPAMSLYCLRLESRGRGAGSVISTVRADMIWTRSKVKVTGIL